MKIKLAAYLQFDSIVDGEGIRTVIWTQGCPHHCLGCHNPETWDPDLGEEVDVEEVCEIIDNMQGQDGITFSGGDPFMQPEACSYIAKHARKKGYSIWSYTGYTWEELMILGKENKAIMDFLKELDVLVDGRFILGKKSYACLFRGSTNQRIINVPESLKKKKVVLMDEYLHKDNESNRKRAAGIYI